MKERFTQLDALRGLAAIAVMFSHLVLIPMNMPITKFSPFRFLVNGHEAVILFFILSGFVLSLPLLNGNRPSYISYIIRRFFRIYVPYIVSFFVAWLLYLKFSTINDGFSEFIQKNWSHDLTLSVIWEHISGILNFHTIDLNVVYWSLVHEMRISIFFPFIVLLLINVRWYYTVLIGLLLTVIGSIGIMFHFGATDDNTSYFDSIHYLSFFLYGLLLAKHRHHIVSWFRTLRKPLKYSMLMISFFCYNYSAYAFFIIRKLGINIPFDNNDPLIAVGVVGIITIALSSQKAARALQMKLPVFLGNVSYSLYLYHLVIMLALVHSLSGRVSLPYLILTTVIISLTVAYVGWRFIEKPSMLVGRLLTQVKSERDRKEHSTKPIEV